MNAARKGTYATCRLATQTLLVAACVVLVLELPGRGGLAAVLDWPLNQPSSALLNLWLSTAVLVMAVGLCGRPGLGLGLGVFALSLFGAINFAKLTVLKTPFFAWDILYLRQMYALAEVIPLSAGTLVAGSLILLTSGYLAWRSFRYGTRLGLFYRTALVCLAVVGFAWFFSSRGPLYLLRVENIVWNQDVNYETHGFLLAFSMNINPLLINQPETYDSDVVQRIIVHNEIISENYNGEGRPVSLIIFMSESFSDLSGVTILSPENPLENFQRLAATYPSFRLVSPTVSGGTSLVEFEVLTGLFNAFLPPGAIPFDHYIRRPVPSLVSFLRDKGYQTVAIHPFHSWYWNRENVYPHLGFQRFIALEHFQDAYKRGPFVSDESLVDKIIEVIDGATGPYCIHAVSMQNHGPYFPGRLGDELVVDGDFPEALRLELGSYLTGVMDSDRQLARLLQFLERRDEQVIVLFFGDHQPSLGTELARLSSLAEPVSDLLAIDYKLHQTPGLLWANKAGLLDPRDIPEQLSPAYLPALVLHQMGHALPGNLFFLHRNLQAYPVIHRKFVLDREGNIASFDNFKSDTLFDELNLLQYDILFGEGFSYSM